MARLLLAVALTLAAGGAGAHPSIVVHQHPHGLSAILGLDILALVALGLVIAAGGSWIVARRGRRRSR